VVHGDGAQSRDFTFVADTVRANLLAAEAPAAACAGRVFNIARGRPVSVLDLLGALGEAQGQAVTPRHAPARAGDVRHSHADISAAREGLGYEPSVSLEEGLARTLAWFGARRG
jgi:nucleoside-diphosphate-sugar epimerase